MSPRHVDDLYDRAAIIPGRSLTRSKAPDRLLRDWARATDEATIYGASGRAYLDMLCGLGAISLGYNDIGGRYSGGVCSLPWVDEIEAAEAVLTHIAPWASHVRFVKTGSEACHAAYRIAKAATGRSRVLVGNWAYHGWHEWCTPPLFLYPHGTEFFAEEGHDIAAVFLEPHRWEPTDLEWLRSVRAFCDRTGALLVFDSMIYGGRWAIGGASEFFGVQPDLECFGKAFGNGRAVAFVVGRDAMRDHGELASGTYSGDTAGLTAVLETLTCYTNQPVIETLWARGKQLRAALTEAVTLAGWEGEAFVEGAGDPHLRLRFVEPVPQETVAPYDYRPASAGARPYAHGFKEQMANRGILWYPDCVNVMYAHTEAQIAQVGQAALDSLKEMR